MTTTGPSAQGPEVAIIGAGAIGCACASWLYSGGHPVTLCSRSTVGEISAQTPQGSLVFSPLALSAGQSTHPHSVVFLATKAQQTASAAAWLKQLCDHSTLVVILQNGVEHIARVRPLVKSATLVPVVIDCPVTRTGPGQIIQSRPGRLVFPDTLAAGLVAKLFSAAPITVQLSNDFVTACWHKLCVNVAGAIPALLKQPLGVLHDTAVAAEAHALIIECIRVGQAEGAKLETALADQILHDLRQQPKATSNSLLRDVLAGKSLEIDARNGAVVRIGRRHGIATPQNQRVIKALLEH